VATASTKKKPQSHEISDSLPSQAHALASIGKETANKVIAFYRSTGGEGFFARADEDSLKKLAAAFEG
jgi:hypothetical protein